MTSWGVRKPITTYSRKKKRLLPDEDEDRPTKQQRVAASEQPNITPAATTTSSITSRPTTCELSNTPASSPPNAPPVIFSDGSARSTPPSSPQPPYSSPPINTRRSKFSFMKRRPGPTSVAKVPLSTRSDNVPGVSQPPAKKVRMVQMQLDLVGDLRKTCKMCGMEYIPSNADDAALHRKFHAMNVGGVDFAKPFVDRLRKNQIWSGVDRSFIAVVGRKDTVAMRNKAVEVLKVVDTELGAVNIAEETLWGQISTCSNTLEAEEAEVNAEQQRRSQRRDRSMSDRYKVYLYVRGQKCVGACLAERIQEAYPVLGHETSGDAVEMSATKVQSSSISMDTHPVPAILGISRIWTSTMQRKAGVATRLLDSAREDFLYGMTVEKAMVAFTQPTESGGQLARRWFGQDAGWHVYVD
ncbi:hypothetical protein BU24DRAFT_421482 [Aaosphaeria arxii CBS 175.79]|uniref:Sister chromatid cohesion acetyltransferas-like protein Eco1 n=1 Tax=Aaosphaeria arxii CBS 175.79 TaxID=1450172 RepID=A0A6A5XZS7_9PLEO|nr:uncharacterized protein BU24DRAFT_421482 [Aaosphaeria arxii CBS 175.79]KAF2018499.1 hypothetical protein BU24DRAFT_421482 [Aaosphaeria arxii CBS 175.79]